MMKAKGTRDPGQAYVNFMLDMIYAVKEEYENKQVRFRDQLNDRRNDEKRLRVRMLESCVRDIALPDSEKAVVSFMLQRYYPDMAKELRILGEAYERRAQIF